jgi:hypothetical protein
MIDSIAVVTDATRAQLLFSERYGFVPLIGVRDGALHGNPTPMSFAITTTEQTVMNWKQVSEIRA